MDDEPRGFDTTDWSLVGKLGQGDDAARRAALGRLLQLYLPALKNHLLRKRRLPPAEVDDLLQEFVRCKILERDLLTRADRSRGKFRSFLLTALDNFVHSELRKQRTRKRAAEYGTPLDDAGDVAETTAPEADVFDTTWAVTVVAESLRRMMAACLAEQRPQTWGVFACRILPLLDGGQPLPYEQVVERFGFTTERQAANALAAAQRKFRGLVRATVADYAGAAAVDGELLDLQQILRQAGVELIEQLRAGLWPTDPEMSVASSVTGQPNPQLLVRLLQSGAVGRRPHAPADLAALWRDLLTSPMQFDLPECDADAAWAVTAGVLPRYDDLFHHPHPPLALLEQARQFAKQNREDPDSSMPEALATMLYYVSIAVALVRHQKRISSLDGARLRKGLQWAFDQPWLDERTRSLIHQGIGPLGSEPRTQ